MASKSDENEQASGLGHTWRIKCVGGDSNTYGEQRKHHTSGRKNRLSPVTGCLMEFFYREQSRPSGT